MPRRRRHHDNNQKILCGAFLGLTAVFFSLVATIQNNDTQFVAASLVQASTEERMLSAESVKIAVEQRRVFLERSVIIDFVDDASDPITSSAYLLKDFPAWVAIRKTIDGESIGIDRERVKQYVISYPPEGIPLPKTCTVTSHRLDEQGIDRVETDCRAQSGYRYDVDVVTEAIVTALKEGNNHISLTLEKVPGMLLDPERSPGKPLVLLSSGRSNFKGSGWERKYNVRKALNERENNIFIPADTTFSFNDTLGIVSQSRGWQLALTIFEGVNLRPAPGGGICQASTTVYRAAINAGLPIVEQKNHSLYVTYYEAYGVGLDATIFPGSQDMQFQNDTGGPIVMQSYTEGDEAFVNMYGYDDGRSVVLSGPYFTRDEGILENGKKIRSNEIVWVRTVKTSTEDTRDLITARYNSIPYKLPSRWEAGDKVTRAGNTVDTDDVVAVADGR